MSNVTFQIHNVKNFSEKERTKFFMAIEKAENVINSIEFGQRVMVYPFIQTNGFNNMDVYNMFMSGADKFNKSKDNDLDVYITMYYSFGRAIGYTLPSTWFTWINRKFFSRFNHASIGGNVTHEYCHNLGFGHISAKDHDSVPYAIGYIVRNMILEKDTYGRYLTIEEVADKKNEKPVKARASRWSRFKSFLKRLF